MRSTVVFTLNFVSVWDSDEIDPVQPGRVAYFVEMYDSEEVFMRLHVRAPVVYVFFRVLSPLPFWLNHTLPPRERFLCIG